MKKERRSCKDRRNEDDDSFKMEYIPFERRASKRRIYPEDFEHSWLEQVLIARGVIRIADEKGMLRVHTIIQKEGASDEDPE